MKWKPAAFTRSSVRATFAVSTSWSRKTLTAYGGTLVWAIGTRSSVWVGRAVAIVYTARIWFFRRTPRRRTTSPRTGARLMPTSPTPMISTRTMTAHRCPILQRAGLWHPADTGQLMVEVIQSRKDHLPIKPAPHQLAGRDAQCRSQGRLLQHAYGPVSKLHGSPCQEIVLTVAPADPGDTQRRGDDRHPHGHSLEHLQPNPASHPHRYDERTGSIEPRTLIRDGADNLYTVQACQPLVLRAQISSHDQESSLRSAPADQRPDLRREPADRVDIRAVIHLSDEQDRLPI